MALILRTILYSPAYFSGTYYFYFISLFYNCFYQTNQSGLKMSLTSPVVCASDAFFFLSRLLFLYFLSSDESDSLDDESDKLGYESESSVTYSFCYVSLSFYNYVVSILGSDVFAPTGFKSKGGRLLAFFWRSNY